MKGKKSKEIIIIPPGGKGFRIVHVPRGVIVFLIILILCGFSGYFIPFNNFTLDVVEKNQKRNLDDQNKRLLSEIRPTRKYLENLDNEIVRLEQKKQKISGMLGLDTPEHQGVTRSKNVKVSLLSLDELMDITTQEYELFSSFAALNDKTAYFDDIPVIKPVVASSFIGAHFGKCRDPFVDYMKMHYGVDFFVPRGSPVIATASGTVTKVEDGRIWGRRIFINHDHGFFTVYAHLGSVEVFTGKKVRKGEQIATAGLSGLSTGIHVHYEIWHNGKAENPEEYFFPNFADNSSIMFQTASISE